MKDLIGMVFNSWTVIGGVQKESDTKIKWACKCKCGDVHDVNEGNLISGRSTGCLKCRKTCATHSYAGNHRLYSTWKSMRTLESSFKEGLTLDRKDNDKGYSKENCKWSTAIEQTSNQRKNVHILYKGVDVTEMELSRLTGVPRTTIQVRRNKGASVEEMIYGFK